MIIIILIVISIFFIINKLIKIKEVEYFTPFPIDIVYTWKGEKASNNIRDSYNYELQYSLRSIYLYANWVNNIYILTDPFVKRPSWIKDSYKIIMIDTSQTFTKEYLPNSNSNAIETTIINIKGLSEHYIYFCDDIFLGRETKFTDFFTADGKALIDKRSIINNSILGINSNLKINPPSTVNRFYPHIPIPQLKSVVKKFYETYPEYIDWIRSTKNRKGDGREFCIKNNLNFPCQQIHYPIAKFMLSENKAKLFDYDSPSIKIFIMNDKIFNENKLDTIIQTKPLFFCINDDEKNPIKRIKVRKEMLAFFKYYYNVKPSYEK